MRIALLALASTGCVLHVDSARNAPGNVKLHDPPDVFYAERPRIPASMANASDPGERVVLAPVAATIGVNKHYTTLGGEVALLWGTREGRHTSPFDLLSITDDMLLRPRIGWSFVRIDESDRTTLGPIYAGIELERFVPSAKGPIWGFSAALGPVVDPARADAGGQLDICTSTPITYALNAFCFRGSWYASYGFDPQMVITIRGFLGWTESL